MSFIGKVWQYVKHWWNGMDGKHGVCIDQYPKEKVLIGIGGSTKLSANVTISSHESFIKWQKVEGNKPINLRTDSIKYSGSSCSLPTPKLVINDVDETDAGVYQLSVTTVTRTVTGPKVLLNVFGGPVMSVPKETRNYFLYYFLCQKLAIESVRMYFTRKIPEPSLAAHLNCHMINLKSSIWKCTKDQLHVLFPAAPEYARSSNFDFSLLYKLIRNTINPLSAPTRGWGQKPLPGDSTEEDDIERIRHHRNILAHNTEFNLNNSDFNNLWIDLSKVIDRLSNGSLSGDVIKLSKMKLDSSLLNQVFEKLEIEMEYMKGEVNTLHQDMEECKDRIQMIENIRIPSNIRRTHRKLLTVWKKEDDLYCDSTHVYKATKDKVQSCSTVALIGGLGCGKTATARHIALQYEQKGWEIVPVFRIEEIVKYGDRKLKQIFVLDDILGEFDIEMSLYHSLNSHKDGIRNAMSKDSKLVCTCRKSVYNAAVKLKPFVLENNVDLESAENQLNEREKETMLAKHCRHMSVPENLYCNVSLSSMSSSIIMFPLLCKIFSTNHENHASLKKFFANPFSCLIDELDKLERICPVHYAAMVLCVLSNNTLSKIDLPVDEIKIDAYNTCGVNRGTSDRELINALSNLVGTFLIQYENDFTFIHGAIFEIIAYHYGKNCPQMILRYMKSNFIATKVVVHMEKKDDLSTDLFIKIDKDSYKYMAERLYTDLQSLELFLVFMNKSLSYAPFLEVFITTLKQKTYKELIQLLCRKQNVLKVSLGKYSKEDEQRREKNEEQSRQKLLLNWATDKHLMESYHIRVISWVIYYGHTRLLKSIVDLVLEHNESTDIVFGSTITEQTRLLTLGCYSGKDDMVNLILKYVNIDCVNRTSLNNIPDCCHPKDIFLIFDGHATYTPLTAASNSGHLSVVKILLQKNVNIDQCDDSDRFPLLTASEKGHYDIVEYLVQNFADVNKCDRYSISPLYQATKGGHYEVVKYLIQNGAKVNQNDIKNTSPLHLASLGGYYNVVEYLVQNEASINQCDQFNQTPLIFAVETGNSDIVKFLIRNNADPTVRTNDELSALQLAVYLNFFEIAKELIRAENQKTPLSGNLELLDIFIDIRNFEVSINDGGVCHDYVGTVPKQHFSKGLIRFILMQRVGFLQNLFDLGLNVNQCNNESRSLLNIIMEELNVVERYRKVELFIQNGADLTVRDGQSLSILEKTKNMIERNPCKSIEYNDIILILRRHIRRYST